jgi:protein-S-isoprenylcysteine O-methyltransferase Ste14
MIGDFLRERFALLAGLGRKMFPLRLVFGLIVVFAAMQWLSPVPFSAPGYLMLHASALLVIFAGLLLRAWGAGAAGDHTRGQAIEAPRLITGGPFAFVRNPIYLGSILLGIGMSMLLSDPRAFLCTAIAFCILFFTIVPAEEEFLAEQFGGEYRHYCKAVPRMLPRLNPWAARTTSKFHWPAVRGEFGMMLLLALIYAVLLFEQHRIKA